jgi:hypothetical protein
VTTRARAEMRVRRSETGESCKQGKTERNKYAGAKGPCKRQCEEQKSEEKRRRVLLTAVRL